MDWTENLFFSHKVQLAFEVFAGEHKNASHRSRFLNEPAEEKTLNVLATFSFPFCKCLKALREERAEQSIMRLAVLFFVMFPWMRRKKHIINANIQ